MSRFTVRGAEPRELATIGADITALFHNGDTGWGQRIAHRPGFEPAFCRVGVLDKQIVSHVLIEPRILRYGSARLKVVGIGKVYTDARYRQRGYSNAVMQDALAFAAEQGAHLALLNGGQRSYKRFGFSPVLPYYYAEFDSQQTADLDAPLELRPPRRDDIGQMAALYERHWGGRVTYLRNPELWVWRAGQDEEGRHALVAVDARGVTQGYIAGRDFASPEVEIVADTSDAALTLLSYSGRWHLQAGKERVAWLMPPDDAILAFARQSMTVTLSAAFEPESGWQARLIDVPALIDALLTELITQARTIDTGNTIFICHPSAVEIGLKGVPTSFSQLAHRDFIQVMFGSLSPTTLGLRSRLHQDSVRLLQAFFPPRMAALGCWDWF